jgi:hypothetical protein
VAGSLTIVPANEATWEAGFSEIARPTIRRVVMSVDFS